jgi:hypothetical protein
MQELGVCQVDIANFHWMVFFVCGNGWGLGVRISEFKRI